MTATARIIPSEAETTRPSERPMLNANRDRTVRELAGVTPIAPATATLQAEGGSNKLLPIILLALVVLAFVFFARKSRG